MELKRVFVSCNLWATARREIMKIVTATKMTRIDRRTIEEFGVPGEVLMERAGKGVFRCITRMMPDSAKGRVLLFAGRGNNGGDAFVVARLLQQCGISNTTVLLAKESEVKGDAATNLTRLLKSRGELVVIRDTCQLHRIRVHDYDIVVEGILGTGIKGAVKGFYGDVIEFINAASAAGKKVLAIDIPSGINGDTGCHEGPCIRADLTVTMGLPKEGLLRTDALNYVGKLEVVDIGIPEEVIREAQSRADLLTEKEIAALMPRRNRITHKGDYGRVFVLAGSRGLTGAATMVCSSAMRAGSGLVFLGIPGSLNPILEVKLTETMTVPLDETPEGTIAYSAKPKILKWLSECTNAVIGPGISTHPETARLVQDILREAKTPLLIDADGLNCLHGKGEILRNYPAPLIVTPHPGEMSRLTGLETHRILEDPWKVAKEYAREWGAIVVLKGAETVIADADGSLYINIAGDAGMASGGMGDVLSGVIASLVGQGLKPIDAAKLGTFVHGRAGEIGVERKGQLSLIASDVIELLPVAFEEVRLASRNG
ncbi:MAG: NAD(P)H-hydrate dehydratase [bacterium]|nr:NAD(P)H-hydrate dehydratase [bacterium]